MNYEIEQFPKLSSRNRAEISKTSTCGCYFCIRFCDTRDIVEWADAGETALCPHCGVDALIPGPVCKTLLVEGKVRYFTKKS